MFRFLVRRALPQKFGRESRESVVPTCAPLSLENGTKVGYCQGVMIAALFSVQWGVPVSTLIQKSDQLKFRAQNPPHHSGVVVCLLQAFFQKRPPDTIVMGTVQELSEQSCIVPTDVGKLVGGAFGRCLYGKQSAGLPSPLNWLCSGCFGRESNKYQTPQSPPSLRFLFACSPQIFNIILSRRMIAFFRGSPLYAVVIRAAVMEGSAPSSTLRGRSRGEF